MLCVLRRLSYRRSLGCKKLGCQLLTVHGGGICFHCLRCGFVSYERFVRSFDEAAAFSTMAREESACSERDRAISDWCGKNAHFRFPSPGPVEVAMSIAADFVLLMRRVSWSRLQGAALPVCVCVKCIIYNPLCDVSGRRSARCEGYVQHCSSLCDVSLQD